MRNKILISNKLDRINSELRRLNFYIGRNERNDSYKALDNLSTIVSEINTLLNTETQD